MHRPLNANLRIAKVDTAFSLRVVDSRALVLHFTSVGKSAEAAREAIGSPYLLLVLRRNLHAHPFPQRRGTLSDVYRHQESGAARDAHQFAHRGIPLKMEPAKHPLG